MDNDNGGNIRGIGADVVYRLRTELGETLESILAMPEDSVRRAVLKLEQPDRAQRRIEYEVGAVLDDSGNVAAGAPIAALEQATEMRNSAPPGIACGMPVGNCHLPTDGDEAAPVAGLAAVAGWTEIGPDNIGGRTRSLVIDPTNTDHIFAGGVGGGVWKSTDGGSSWTPTDDQMRNLAICSMVMHPSDSDMIFAGTGEGFNNADALRGDGIFVTTDGAANWTQLSSTAANADFLFVNTLAISPDGSVLLAGTRSGMFRSIDNGASWAKTSSIQIGNVAFDRNDSSSAIAGTLRSGGAGGTALFSDDGGQSWISATIPAGTNGRVQVCYSAASSSVTYASVDATPSHIWRSVDGGETYLRRGAMSGGIPASFLGQQGWYDNTIWAGDPTNVDLVVVGGIDLWRSTDGGDNLIQISTWWSPGSAHADQHLVLADPGYNGTTNRRVYFGNDGGVYRTDDVSTVGNNASPPYTNGWNSLSQGYAVTQFYYGAGHIGTSTIVGGTQDNGTLRYTPSQGTDWNKVFGGDGGGCASSPADSQTWYGEYVFASVFRNTDGGATNAASQYISGRHWTGSQWIWKSDPFTIADARDSNAQFIAPFALDPNNADRLIVGGKSLWLSTDPTTPNTPSTGPSWQAIKPPIGNDRQHTITSIVVADGDSEVIMVGHANGDLYRTMNGTAALPGWSQVDTNGIGANRQCLGLAIDPDDHQVAYATFGGYQTGNVFKTIDGGTSWTDSASGLPDAPVRAITLHPQRSAWVYVATEVGVFGSEDGGATWSPTNEGPANVACRDLFWLGCVLVAATHGRGMFQIDLTIANAFPAPALAFTGAEDYVANGQNFTRYSLDITNADRYPSSLFRPSPDLPPCGLNQEASRTWVDIYDADSNQRIYGFCALNSSDDLRRIWFGLPAGVSPPASVSVVLRDRRCSQSYTSNAVDPSADDTDSSAERRITMVDRVDGVTVRVGGPWGVATVQEVVASIESGANTYYIEEGGQRAKVSIVNGKTMQYLRSYGDQESANNLDDLPPIS